MNRDDVEDAPALKYPRAYARNSDPDTSREAADSMTPGRLGEIEGRVVAALKAEPFGLTVPEIADALDLPRDTVSPRMKTLVRRGLVEDSGAKKRPDGHKVSCIIWKAKP